MNQLSLEKEISDEVEKVLNEYRKLLNEDFKIYESYAKFCIEQSNRLSKITHDVENMFKSRPDSVVTKGDLELLSVMMALQSQMQLSLATISYQSLIRLKELAYLVVKAPLDVAVKVLFRFTEDFAPKLGSKIREMVDEKFYVLLEEIQRLKKRKEKIKLEATKDIAEAMKSIQEWIERARKAQATYVR